MNDNENIMITQEQPDSTPDAPHDTAPQTEPSLPHFGAEAAPTPGAQIEEGNIIPKKKNNKIKIAVISAVAGVLIIGGAATAIILSSGNRPGEDYDPYEGGDYIDIQTGSYYSGVVEPQETVKVNKDSDLKIDQVFVEVGDTVKKGDKLFSYDSAQAKLDLELAKLEYDGISNEIDSYTDQIAELTKQRAEAEEDQKLDYTLQIQQAEINKSRSQMSLKSKKVEVENLEKKVKTAAVTAPIAGVIKSVSSTGSADDDGMDTAQSDSAFITILTADSYRVKCSIDELNIGSIYEGMEVRVHSRADQDKVWEGSISKIDYESAANNNENEGGDYYYYDSGMQQESATKYTFYVTLDKAQDILLGQHVYVEIDVPMSDDFGDEDEWSEDEDPVDDSVQG